MNCKNQNQKASKKKTKHRRRTKRYLQKGKGIFLMAWIYEINDVEVPVRASICSRGCLLGDETDEEIANRFLPRVSLTFPARHLDGSWHYPSRHLDVPWLYLKHGDGGRSPTRVRGEYVHGAFLWGEICGVWFWAVRYKWGRWGRIFSGVFFGKWGLADVNCDAPRDGVVDD